MIGDDPPDGRWHSDWPKFGGILLIFGKAEEIGVSKISLDAFRHPTVVDARIEETQGLVDFGAISVD